MADIEKTKYNSSGTIEYTKNDKTYALDLPSKSGILLTKKTANLYKYELLLSIGTDTNNDWFCEIFSSIYLYSKVSPEYLITYRGLSTDVSTNIITSNTTKTTYTLQPINKNNNYSLLTQDDANENDKRIQDWLGYFLWNYVTPQYEDDTTHAIILTCNYGFIMPNGNEYVEAAKYKFNRIKISVSKKLDNKQNLYYAITQIEFYRTNGEFGTEYVRAGTSIHFKTSKSEYYDLSNFPTATLYTNGTMIYAYKII